MKLTQSQSALKETSSGVQSAGLKIRAFSDCKNSAKLSELWCPISHYNDGS